MNKIYSILGENKTYDDTKAYIDKYYYDVKKNGYSHRTAHVLDLIDETDTRLNILDYGCGWGIFSRIISEKSSLFDVTGIDLDPMSLSIAQDVTPPKNNLFFLDKSIGDLKEKSFDYVISMQVIEHVHNPGNYLKEINRVLAINGYLVISLPNVMQPVNFLWLLLKSAKKLNNKLRTRSKYMLNNYKKEHDHIHSWDPGHFVNFVSSLGFELESMRMVEGVPFPFKKYWHTSIPGIKNLSYKMVFKFKKVKYVDIKNND